MMAQAQIAVIVGTLSFSSVLKGGIGHILYS